MKRSWFSILLVCALLGMLGLLAALQYRWLGQISEGERERMQKRVQDDTDRFAEDFNQEIRKAYFNFQIDAEAWKKKDWSQFSDKYAFWKNNSTYPELITDFYFVKKDNAPLRYDAAAKNFVAADLPGDIGTVAARVLTGTDFNPVAETAPALVMPVYEELPSLPRSGTIRIITNNAPPAAPRPKFGFIILKLDRAVIGNRILPDLSAKYFPAGGGSDFRVFVTSEKDPAVPVYQNDQAAVDGKPDSSAKLFNLAPEKMAFFVNRELTDSLSREPARSTTTNVVISRSLESRTFSSTEIVPDKGAGENHVFTMQRGGPERRQMTVMETGGPNANGDGLWTLGVQHRDGSLDQFIANTRNKNLAVSFGILGLLGLSVVMIFISAQRARVFAQRQMDFVSSVSHEFRTPLAVIYSAGENLTDGVVDSKTQVVEYGSLIKHEGKKLSSMVEQILEFAGARSGKRKYDFREVSIDRILTGALADCRPLAEKTGFEITQNIQPNLPAIQADEKALGHAFQNLISNAIKYSDAQKSLHISAENGGGTIKLSFEDKGRGISKRDRAHIFEPFFRGRDVVEAQIHGNGLGLSLVKQIVDAHDGTIRVESAPGAGSKFTIELPV